MTFPILGGNSAVGGYEIANSLRFNDNDSARLTKSFSAGNRDLFTWSCWVKRGNLSANMNLFREDTTFNLLRFNSSNQLEYFNNIDSATIVTNALYRDVSGWYNIQFVYDSGNATSSDRLRLYVNGERITSFSSSSYPSLNADSGFNSGVTHSIGARPAGAEPFDGYMAEVHFIDGQALSPTDFGSFDEDSGIWKPEQYTGTYTGNSFYLDFENSGSLGADASGLGNNWSPTNLASTDQMLDTPTNNFCTLNVLDKNSNPVLYEGNLKITTSVVNVGVFSNFGVSQGKWYFEFVRENSSLSPTYGVALSSWNKTYVGFTNSIGYVTNGYIYNNGSVVQSGLATCTTGDIVSIKLDLDAGSLTFFKNNVQIGTPITGLSGEYFPAVAGQTSSISVANFGQDSSFAGNKTRQNNSDENGYGDFYYTPPSGYLALCTQNLATVLSPTIDDGSQYFNTVLANGNGASQSITGVGFQPDWVWLKTRNLAVNHISFDSVRGAGLYLTPNLTNAEGNVGSSGLVSFDADGFTYGNAINPNYSNATFVAWNWKAGGTGVTNTDGSITSTVSANQTSGFSIVTYTGTGSAGSFGHGLTSPKIVLIKDRSDTLGWYFHTTAIDGSDDYLFLDQTTAKANASAGYSIGASVYNLGGGGSVTNLSGHDYVAYCFAPISGYSAMGTYIGNGSSTDGTYVNLSFRPSFVMVKRTDAIGNWCIYDNKRNGFNPDNDLLIADLSNSEYDVQQIDLLSNGFKWRSNANSLNASGGTYIYACFSANPFVSSTGIPVTAR